MPVPASIPLPQVKLGKRKQRSQMWEMYTVDGRSVDVEIDVLQGCCDDVAHGKAFLIDPNNQYTNEQGYWVQVGWEMSLMPLCTIEETKILGAKNKPGTDDDDDLLTVRVNQTFHEASEARKELVWSKVNKNMMMEKLTWLIAIPCITALLAFALIAWRMS